MCVAGVTGARYCLPRRPRRAPARSGTDRTCDRSACRAGACRRNPASPSSRRREGVTVVRSSRPGDPGAEERIGRPGAEDRLPHGFRQRDRVGVAFEAMNGRGAASARNQC